MISRLRSTAALLTVAATGVALLACAPQPGGTRATGSHLRYATFEVPINEHVLLRWPEQKMSLRVHLPTPPEGLFEEPIAIFNSVRDGLLDWTDHALGIGGHSPDPGDIMYAQASTTASNGLSERDRAKLAELYARPIGSRVVGGRGHR